MSAPAQDEQVSVVARRRLWRVLVLAFLAECALALAVFAVHDDAKAAAPGPPKVTTSSYVDGFGRQCTRDLATTADGGLAVALSCAPKPVEDRAADGVQGFLDGLEGGQ